MAMTLTRRSFVAGTALGSASILVRSFHAADYTFTQLHNQTAASSLHQRLVAMWAAIRTETGGRVETQVLPENNKIAGGDPAALKMLVAGEIQFFTLQGGLLSNVVPVADVQQLPFAYRSASEAHRVIDGPLGAYLREEMAAKGIFGFPIGAFDNGMRQMGGTKPITVPADLIGVRMRIPAGQVYEETFRALGAEPVAINADGIYDALKTGKVDAQENPLAIVDLFKIYEVLTYISMSNHMWSGFNLLAHLPAWKRLPNDIQAIIERNAAKYVALQRRDQQNFNEGLRAALAQRGIVFNDVDSAPFRAKLSGLYATWKVRLGTRCWSLLEAATGVRY